MYNEPPMTRFWIAVRFLIFLPVAVLLILGYVLAAMVNLIVLSREGRNTIRRFWMSWWLWVTGEISTYELIK